MSFPSTELRASIRQEAPIPLDATIDCGGGELLALVGPSGSGKSTLLRMIAGLAQPKSGRVQCGEKVWFDAEAGVSLSPQQRNVGFVPQNFGLFPHLSALDNIEAGLAHLQPIDRRTRAQGWIAKVGLVGLERRLPDELSGGQQQRVALARALARHPSLLLLDEPFSSVDRTTRETLYTELAELKQELALPIIMVTHDLTEALLLADRMTLLDGGRTLQSGVPGEVLARPVSAAAARLMGLRNVLQGRVLRHEPAAGRTWVDVDGIALATPLRTEMAPGTDIRLLLPNGAIRLPGAQGRPLPDSPNRLRITIASYLPMGEEARLTARMEGVRQPVQMSISLHLAQALGITAGREIDAVLREENLHAMRD